MGKVVSVNVSRNKGTPKQPVPEIWLVPGRGVQDDAHAAPGDRQVSLLMLEDIAEAQKRLNSGQGCEAPVKVLELGPGVFAENITTEGIELPSLPLGTGLRVGPEVRLRVSKIGKECPRPCAIFYQTGDCIMPRRGIFAEVIQGGAVKPGDRIEPD